MAATRTCAEPGCGKSTREGKPYCPDHVFLTPYVADLVLRMDRRKKEQEEADRVERAVKALGATTVGGLARAANVARDRVREVAADLADEGRVTLHYSRNTGRLIVRLAE